MILAGSRPLDLIRGSDVPVVASRGIERVDLILSGLSEGLEATAHIFRKITLESFHVCSVDFLFIFYLKRKQ